MHIDPRVNAYVQRQAEFARPILEYLRAAVHTACPDCEETLKWGAPAFLYKGQQLALMAAFKQHATFSFRHGGQIVPEGERRDEAMGQFGRLTSTSDLPEPDRLMELARAAMALIDAGVKPTVTKHPKGPVEVPPELRSALDANPAAAATFDGFSESARRDYADWVREAKREETRAKRIAQAVEWLAQGKKRNWKYEKC